MVNNSVRDFYDELAPDYGLIYKDWRSAVQRQGEKLDQLIRSLLPVKPPIRLLDCSCGIGTQAIGLALRGYRVRATDLSPHSIQEARRHAARLKARLQWGTADFLQLTRKVPGRYQVVLSCDNALPHLLTNGQIGKALRQMYEKLDPGGLLLLSLRDYGPLLKPRTNGRAPVLYQDRNGKRVCFQVWEWKERKPVYRVHLCLLQEQAGRYSQKIVTTYYRALRPGELVALLKKAGFASIRWREPRETGYHQPIVTALRP